jgi:uncharacterized repeat protein (TIGR01451 family)
MKHWSSGLIISCVIVSALLARLALAAGPASVGEIVTQAALIGQEGGATYAVALQGTYAYVGVGPRLVVLDVSDPEAPVVAGRGPVLPDLVRGLAPAGDIVYVAAGKSGVLGIDITDSTSPIWRSALDTPGWAHAVAIAGTRLYVADGSGGLRIVDIADPLLPLEIASISTAALGGEVQGLAVAGNTLCIGAGAGGLVTVDVTAPEAPVVVGSYAGPIATHAAISGDTVYVVDSRELRVFALDISHPTSPSVVHHRPIDGVPERLYVQAPYLYVAAGESGLEIFEIEPESGLLSHQTTHDTPGAAHDVALWGPNAFVADGRAGLRIVDVLSDRGSPEEVGAYEPLGDAVGLEVDNRYAHVAAGEGGLSIVDLTDLSLPMQVARLDLDGYAQALTSSGPLAFIAGAEEGLAVVDVADPSAPALLARLQPPEDGEAWRSVARQGDLLLIGAESEGLRIVSVATPASPVVVSTLKLAGGHGVWDVASADGYAYLAAGLSGVRVVDFSTPTAPVEVATLDTVDWAWAIDLVDGLLYIADIDGGLSIVDVSSPAAPVPISTYTGTLGAVTNVTVHGSHALITTDDVVAILDVANPAYPVLRTTYPTAGTPQAIAAGDAVLVADLNGGLRVLDPVDVAVGVTIDPASPEPDTSFTLAFAITNRGPSPAPGVHFTHPLPSALTLVDVTPGCSETGGIVTCDVGDLAVDASAAVTVTVTSPSPATLQITGVVSSTASEINAQNNTVLRSVVVFAGKARVYLPLVSR